MTPSIETKPRTGRQAGHSNVVMTEADAADGSGTEGGATTPADPGLAVTVPPVDPPRDASRRGGRIDFATSTDLVDEASQESFPASDSPAWTLQDDRRDEPRKDWAMSKKNIVSGNHEGRPPTPAPSPPPDGEGRTSTPGAAQAQVAALAYELWESRGRPEGTDLEDWFRAERRLQCHT